MFSPFTGIYLWLSRMFMVQYTVAASSPQACIAPLLMKRLVGCALSTKPCRPVSSGFLLLKRLEQGWDWCGSEQDEVDCGDTSDHCIHIPITDLKCCQQTSQVYTSVRGLPPGSRHTPGVRIESGSLRKEGCREGAGT